MDIKLKRYSVFLKITAFIMVFAMSFSVIFIGLEIKTTARDNKFGWDFSGTYTDDRSYQNYLSTLNHYVSTIIEGVSEENILAGNNVTQSEIDNDTENMFRNNYHEIFQKLEKEGYNENVITDEMAWSKFQTDYASDIAKIKDDIIRDQLRIFKKAILNLANDVNIQYYINTNGIIYTNTESDYSEIIKREYSFHGHDDYETFLSQYAVSINPEYINAQSKSFIYFQDIMTKYIIWEAVCLLLFFISLFYLIYAAGKKSSKPNEITHISFDKIYNEFTAGFLVLSALGAYYCLVAIFENVFNKYFMTVLFSLLVCITIWFFLVLVRSIKSRKFFKHTLIYSILAFLCGSLKKIFDAGTPMIKAILIIVILGILTMIPFLGIITIPLTAIFAYIQITKYQTIKKGVISFKNGNYSQKITVKGTGELSKLAEDINGIFQGLGEEVKRRMKSEQLKTELIVNVSHDIKTPLTSIITYVDLLKKENIQNETAQKYIDVIAGKSERLNILIDDLFEASKAATGNIPVNFENVDLNALITQSLGELDEKIKSSALDFKVNLPEKPISVRADGRLLWRVLENLFSNVFKYSFPNSRVYIDVCEDGNNAYIEIKNISATELNIPADEITERFKRGDLSRNSEGSGLGLDIARSLMLCQNGDLTIQIDGDLFKVKLMITKFNN